ncbi:MAG TPA: 23S rRNA (uracil(1939)-C(5))-methyltransferase RlmD [Flavobacteriales bacterium]|nr:23S rRNA (uracil(1939)-C(5))-methyltransferase RlmD [Flavobacteriales bacterium]HRE74588.1 23S rRNA (uracil(1939)-C(5))-methyltransferase RlmD [Flavobacteriales bacterium]HRJ39924.1 23S rRNA (uracil(1939)-C(5))-methyltransferase RlmD [Flavobacteriales bacterium]
MGSAKKAMIGKIVENLEVIDAAAEGKSIARWDERVVFVNGGVPGDIVDVKIIQQKRRFLEGVPVHFHKESAFRTEPFCAHFGNCGGCKWQNLAYEKQLHYKEKQVRDNFERIGHLEFPSIRPILGAPKTSRYRNKLEFTFTDREWLTFEQVREGTTTIGPALGFHVPGKFDRVMRIDECHLMDEPANSIRNWLFQYALEKEISFFNLRSQEGLLRNLVIRNTQAGEVMVTVVFAYDVESERKEILDALSEKFPEITSLFYVINTKRNDSLYDQDMILYKGLPHMTETMEGLKFIIGPKSFYQTNSEQAYHLYAVARELAGLKGDEIVYDLYTGTGTIANFVASKAKKVIGVEYVDAAIEDAKKNSAANGIKNTDFFAGDMKDVLNETFIQTHGQPDVIITDPPRAGMHEDVIQTILKAAPEKIVYVSCNPATQARDLALMKDNYSIEVVQPVDMFPQTHHVENVVLLVRK